MHPLEAMRNARGIVGPHLCPGPLSLREALGHDEHAVAFEVDGETVAREVAEGGPEVGRCAVADGLCVVEPAQQVVFGVLEEEVEEVLGFQAGVPSQRLLRQVEKLRQQALQRADGLSIFGHIEPEAARG